MKYESSTTHVELVMSEKLKTSEVGQGKPKSSPTLARSLSPEDIKPDQYLGVLQIVAEYLVPCPFSSEVTWKTPEVRRVSFTPATAKGPLKVVEVCLPFVLVMQVDGKHRVLDVRKCQLAELNERFGRKVFKHVRSGEHQSLDSGILY
jgi:hypothetical protein